MNEELHRRPGRPKKHPAEEFHFKTAEIEQPSAPPATSAIVEPAAEAEAGSEQSFTFPEEDAQEPAALPAEAVVENPTIALIAGENLSEAFAEPVLMLGSESPVEEKIHELVEAAEPTDLNGWNPLPKCDAPHAILLPPRNGTPVRVSESTQGSGVTAFWKKTRAFANPTKKWETTGIWCDYLTGVKVPFTPKYWKDRYVS